MIKKKFYDVGTEKLAGLSYESEQLGPPRLIFLHGGGTGSKDRRRYMQRLLFEKGISSFSFDFSGHGESSGKIENSSLEKRLNEAKKSITAYLDTSKEISICASSMGAHIAVELLEHYPVKTLILIAPAVYSKAAFNIPFNSGFSDIIRQKDSWKDNSTMKLLNAFQGNVLVFLAENDTVIPRGVIDMIKDNIRNSNYSKIEIIKEAPHALHNWISKDPDLADRIAREIAGFV